MARTKSEKPFSSASLHSLLVMIHGAALSAAKAEAEDNAADAEKASAAAVADRLRMNHPLDAGVTQPGVRGDVKDQGQGPPRGRRLAAGLHGLGLSLDRSTATPIRPMVRFFVCTCAKISVPTAISPSAGT